MDDDLTKEEMIRQSEIRRAARIERGLQQNPNRWKMIDMERRSKRQKSKE